MKRYELLQPDNYKEHDNGFFVKHSDCVRLESQIHHWIPVSSPPTKAGEYLCKCDDGVLRLAVFHIETGHWLLWGVDATDWFDPSALTTGENNDG